MSEHSAAIYGLSGLELSSPEADFFREVQPWGFILFKRNIETPQQTRNLVDQLRDLTGHADTPILIDQEGGRVRRLKPPLWREHCAIGPIADLWGTDRDLAQRAAFLQARIIAADLYDLGINVNCAPVLDLRFDGASDIIGDRSYGSTVEAVTTLGQLACDGFLDGGVLPVIKHIPGHGRALVDSHEDLPLVEASKTVLDETDFAPFKALNKMPMAMTAHIIYQALDDGLPATWSNRVIDGVIREQLGFQGLIMSDDLSMSALGGGYRERAEKCLAGGCDMVLHCNGDMNEMVAVASGTGLLEGRSGQRAEAALKQLHPPKGFDLEGAVAELAEIVS